MICDKKILSHCWIKISHLLLRSLVMKFVCIAFYVSLYFLWLMPRKRTPLPFIAIHSDVNAAPQTSFYNSWMRSSRVKYRSYSTRAVLHSRFKNQILCDLHFADVALMECSDFMQQLRSFKPQSLGCAVARRKSSTTLIFPLPPQACSGKCFYRRRQDRLFFFSLLSSGCIFATEPDAADFWKNAYVWDEATGGFRLSWITHDYMSEVTSLRRIRTVECKSHKNVANRSHEEILVKVEIIVVAFLQFSALNWIIIACTR